MSDESGDEQLKKTLKGNSQQLKHIWDNFLEGQKIENGMTADCADINLICPDGCVPVHSFLLQAVSPFFDKIITAQGPLMYLQSPRPVLLPDYKLSEIRRLIQLIYTGCVEVKSKVEIAILKDTISDFQIKITLAEELKKPTRGRNDSQAEVILCYPFGANKTPKENMLLIKTKPYVSLTKANPYATGNKNIIIPASKVTILPNKANIMSPPGSDKSTTGLAANQQKHSAQKLSPGLGNKPLEKRASQHSDSDSESDLGEPTYANRDWFLKEAKRCQFCDKDCKSAAEASQCVTSHNKLRCYFCFKVVRNTEKLFKHFSDKHKKAGRENCLLCPLCEQIVPFKSVSCHVISLHLSEAANNPGNKLNKAPGRPATGVFVPIPAKKARTDHLAPNNSQNNSKKENGLQKESHNKTKGKITKSESVVDSDTPKQHLLTDLDVQFRKQSICGKVRVFSVKKSRKFEAEK